MLKQAQNRKQQVVVLSQVLASNTVSLGIEDITDCQVHRVNGVPIDSLRSLVRLLDGLKGEEKKSGGKGKGKGKATASSSAAANDVAGGGSGEEDGGKFIRFELDYDQLVVLDVNAAREATPGILEMHSIPNDRSADLLAAEDDGDDGIDGEEKEEAKKGGSAGGGKKRKAAAPSAAAESSKRAAAAGKRAVAAGKKKKH